MASETGGHRRGHAQCLANPDVQAETGASWSRGLGEPSQAGVGVTAFKGGLLIWVVSSQGSSWGFGDNHSDDLPSWQSYNGQDAHEKEQRKPPGDTTSMPRHPPSRRLYSQLLDTSVSRTHAGGGIKAGPSQVN